MTNSYFWVRMTVEGIQTIIVELHYSDIPAESWNKLRDKICACKEIKDDTMVYFDYLAVNGVTDRFYSVKVGDWRKLGFSDNNIKHCQIPEEIETNCNFWVYNNNFDVLKHSILMPKQKESIINSITKAVLIVDFKTQVADIRKRLLSIGMTKTEIEQWLKGLIPERDTA